MVGPRVPSNDGAGRRQVCSQGPGAAFVFNPLGPVILAKRTPILRRPLCPCRITKQLLDYLGVEQVAAVVGGSMGGMAVLEWPILFPVRYPSETPSRADAAPPNDSEARPPYIRAVVPIATAARHSAWGISWAEAQRQSIYSDPAFDHGYYLPSDPPRAGLAAARMAALLTYRSRDSFESRFGRRIGGASRGRAAAQHILGGSASADRRASVAEEAALMHNEGNLSPRIKAETSNSPLSALPAAALGNGQAAKPRGTNGTSATNPPQQKPFSAQSYLRYQGDKFVKRFDANCYVHLTRKMDSHDVARGRAYWALPESNGREPETANPIEVGDLAALRRSQQTNGGDIGAVATGAGGVEDEEVAVGEKRLPRDGEEDDEALERVLGLLTRGTYRQYAPAPPFLVVSVESDGLFAPPEQELLHRFIGGSSIVTIQSPDGHDGFLLEFEQINRHVEAFLRPVLSDIYDREHGVGYSEWKDWGKDEGSSSNTAAGDGLGTGGTRVVKESMSGEVEDLTRW